MQYKFVINATRTVKILYLLLKTFLKNKNDQKIKICCIVVINDDIDTRT